MVAKKQKGKQKEITQFFSIANPNYALTNPSSIERARVITGESIRSIRSFEEETKAGEKKRGVKTNIIILSSSEPDQTMVVSRRVSVASSTVQDTSTFANTTTRTNTPPPRDLAVEDLTRSVGKLRTPSSGKSHCIFTESPNMIPPSPINFGMDEEDADLQEALRQSLNDTRRREIYGDSAGSGPSGTVSNTRSYASALLNIPSNDRYPTALRSLLDQGTGPYRTVSPPRPTAMVTHLFDEATTRTLQRGKISSKQADALLAPEAVPDEVADDVAAGLAGIVPEEEVFSILYPKTNTNNFNEACL
jgi:hypothetical protein